MTCESGELRAVTARRAPSFAFAAGLLALANFVVVTTEFAIVGMLPAIADDLEVSLAQTGRLVTWFALAAAVLGPPLTMLASRAAPRPVLIATTVAFAAGNLTAALVPDYSILSAARAALGCALPVFVSVASVAAARLAGDGREGWAISLVNIGVVATTVLGIPAAAIVADRAGWSASFVGLALLGAVSIGLIAIWFPNVPAAPPLSVRNEASLLQRRDFLAHLLLSGMLFAAMFAAYTYIAVLLASIADLDGTTVGWMLMGFGVAGALGNWIAGRVVDRDPLAATASVAFILAIAMAAIAGADGILLLALIGLWGGAHMAAFVFSQVRVMQAGREAPAFAMSLNISVCNLGIALGSLAGGWIADSYGVGFVAYGGSGGAAIAFLIALAMAAARPRERPRREAHASRDD